LNQSPSVPQPPRVSVPGVDSLGGLERKQWFLVSDLAGIVRGTLTNVSVLTIIAILLVPLTWWVLWRTSFGLRLRSSARHRTRRSRSASMCICTSTTAS
jgi:simple sugar transport system permease protein